MPKNINEYTASEFDGQLKRLITGLRVGCSPSKTPRAFLLGGQSGAGKTRLQKFLISKYGHNVIVINGDEYRSAHPRFAEIQEEYGIDAPAHTAKWAGAMVEALVDALSNKHFNLIVEGTLRTSAVPMKTAKLLKSRGYNVDLALMAVKPEISLVSCQIRYEQMRIAGTTPRAVDPEHHAKIVNEIVDNLADLEQSDLFGNVSLFNRAGACLFAGKCPNEDTPASRALKDILFGAWTKEEKSHYSALQAQLDELIKTTGAHD